MYDTDFDSVTNNLRDSANGTFVTLDDLSQLTVTVLKVHLFACVVQHMFKASSFSDLTCNEGYLASMTAR